MKRFIAGFMICFLGLSGTAQALEQRGDLILIKGPILEFQNFPPEPQCESFYDIRSGEDRKNFWDYRHVNCQGRYSMTLKGEPGKTVTLFGRIDFGKERGFLIIKKTDNTEIWVEDLEGIPAGQWVHREAQGDYGAYDAYYHAAPQFSINVSSVKWGSWWQEDGSIPKAVALAE